MYLTGWDRQLPDERHRLILARKSKRYQRIYVADGPRYEVGGLELDHVLEGLVPRLATDAVVALERSSRTPAPAWPAGLELDKVSRYGETAVYWLSPVAG